MAEKMDWDLAENMGEEIDDVVREHLEKLCADFYGEYNFEGGYNVIGNDPNFENCEVLEVYYTIKIRRE